MPHYYYFCKINSNQSGETNEFSLELEDVDDLHGIVLSHDGAGRESTDSEWQVASVSIVAHRDAGTWTERYNFACAKAWIGAENDRSIQFNIDHAADEEGAHDHDSDDDWATGDGEGVQFRKTRIGVDMARSKRNKKLIKEIYVKNPNMPGAPELVGRATNFDHNAREMKRMANAQQVTADYRRVNEQVRGEHAGGKHVFDHTAAEMSREMALAKTTWDVKAVNPQQLVPGIMSRDKVADAVHSEAVHTDAVFLAAREEGAHLRGTAVFK